MDKKNDKNWLERIVLGISGALVIFVFGFLIYEMIYEKQTSPNIVVSQGKIERKGNYVALPVSISNMGTDTAENVRIEIIVGSAPHYERSQMVFQYLPGRSTVNGWATFGNDTALDSIRIHILGYTAP